MVQLFFALFLAFQPALMNDDTQPAASKVNYVQSENIIYSLEFKEFSLLSSFIAP